MNVGTFMIITGYIEKMGLHVMMLMLTKFTMDEVGGSVICSSGEIHQNGFVCLHFRNFIKYRLDEISCDPNFFGKIFEN